MTAWIGECPASTMLTVSTRNGMSSADDTHRSASCRALLHKIDQAGDHRRPFGRRVQLDIAAGNARKKGADKKLRLIKALGRKTAFFQLFEYDSCERDVVGRTDRIHGFNLRSGDGWE